MEMTNKNTEINKTWNINPVGSISCKFQTHVKSQINTVFFK